MTQVEDFRHHTCTHIPHDLNTAGLPAPVLFPNRDREGEEQGVLAGPDVGLTGPACEDVWPTGFHVERGLLPGVAGGRMPPDLLLVQVDLDIRVVSPGSVAATRLVLG
jgi:hypothetical protein